MKITKSDKLRKALQVLYPASQGIYYLVNREISVLKLSNDNINTVKELILTWADLFIIQSTDVKRTVIIDFETHIWLMKFIDKLSIAIRASDDSKIFSISFASGELLDTLIEAHREGKTYIKVSLITANKLMKLKREFYDFVKENLGTKIAVKFASNIFGIEEKHPIEMWHDVIHSIERASREVMGPFISRGMADALKEIVNRYYITIKIPVNRGGTG